MILFDDIFLEALDECDYVALFGLRHLELRQGRSGVSEEKTFQSLSLTFMPRWANSISLPR
jgi:hypothetical protein